MKALRVFSAFALVVGSAISAVATTAPAGATSEVSGWVQYSQVGGPNARSGSTMAFDRLHAQMVLFGGYVLGSGKSDQTWLWSGSEWEPQSLVVHPPARELSVMAYDETHDQLILFGGSGINGSLNDTWQWTGSGWTQLFPDHAPSPRHSSAMAFDRSTGELVLFGGADAAIGLRNDTWVWTGSDWLEKSPTNAPGPRMSHVVGYDGVHDQFLLFGGYGAIGNCCYNLNDTWEWTGTDWVQHATQNYPPNGRVSASMAFDELSGRLLLFAGWEYTCCYFQIADGDTWSWSGSSWNLLSPSTNFTPRFGAASAYNEVLGQVMVFGGRGSNNWWQDTWVLGHEQAITFGALSDRGIADPPFAVSATSDSGLAVSFSSDTPSVCTVRGTTVTPVAFGTCAIRASQGGAGTFSPATDVVRSFAITKSSQSITFPDPGEQHIDVTSFDVSPTASSGLDVTVTTEPGSSCSVSGTTVTILGLGTCGLRASQAGDGDYDAALDAIRTVAITKVPQTIDFPVIAGRSVDDPDFPIAPTASSGLTVGLASESTATCTVSGGVVSIVGSGTCRIRATQAGNGFYAAAPDVVHVFTVAPFGGASAGWFGSCAPLSDGTTSCWGRNLLAPTQTSTSAVPVAGIADVRTVTMGASHACGLDRASNVSCWGRNSIGQLGTGSRSATGGPVAPIGLAGAQAISAGGNHTCALMAAGTVKCWGGNSYGELGYGTRNAVLAPVTVRNLSGARAVSAGRASTCAVLETGSVLCWGSNSFGQLGDGTTVSSSLPVAVAGIDDAVDVTVGGFHACANRASGAVVCWGRNSTGQLGNGSKVNSRTPVAVTGLSDVVAVSAGAAHTCAVLGGGTVECWGANMTAQLGDGTRTTSAIPSEVAGLTGAVTVSAGTSHTCARREDRAVLCWGLGTFGRLGSGSTTTRFVPGVVAGVG